MTFDEAIKQELRDLMERQASDTASEKDIARLDELVCSSLEARRHYIETLRLFSDLQFPASNEVLIEKTAKDSGVPVIALPSIASTGAVDEVSAVIIDVKPASLSRRNKRWDSIHWQRHKIRFNAMTAVLTALAWVGFSYFVSFSTTPDHSRPNRGDNIQYVAEITGQHESRWAEGMPPMSGRHAILSGELLNLAEGLIEITFDDGARIVLEGPTEFVVDSPGAGTLEAGKLAAQVPTQARGFTINTRDVTIVDLGTAFDVHVFEDGQMELAVLDGVVELGLDGSSSNTRRMTAGQAVRTHRNNNEIVIANVPARRLVRDLPARRRDRWRTAPITATTDIQAGDATHTQFVQAFNYNDAGATATVNRVVFAGSATFTGLTTSGSGPQNFDGFVDPNIDNADLDQMLQSAAYDLAPATLTLTLTGLQAGRSYWIQLLFQDGRYGGEENTVDDGVDRPHAVPVNSPNYAIVTFTTGAAETSRTIAITRTETAEAGQPQLNGYSLFTTEDESVQSHELDLARPEPDSLIGETYSPPTNFRER